jgi:murein DD-endopeptidase MepM/ murein hydrolase activator NlpD
MIILLAVLVYSARQQIITPFSGSRNTGGAVMTSSLEDPSSPAQTIAEAQAPAEVEGPTIPQREPARGKIGRNSSLYVELTGVGVSPADVQRVARASRKTYNLKRVRPGQGFVAYLNHTGQLDSLDFDVSSEERLMVRRVEGNRFAASIEAIPFDVSYHVTRGIIESSIFASLREQGADTELAGGLDEIFGWTIDFIADTRRGDTYTVLYERKTFEDGRSVLGDILAARVVNRGDEYHAFQYKPEGNSRGYYDLDGKSLQKSLRRSPLKYTRVTSNFQNRRYHPVYKTYRPHYGVDYGAPRGTPVYATGDGTVLTASRRRGNGNYVKIKHNNTYTTYYLHLNGFARGVKSGVRVRQGQLIGYVGSTGAANGPHVCYRIKRNGGWVNPRRLELPSKKPVPDSQLASYERARNGYMVRLREVILSGLENNTIVVERPSQPTDGQMQTLF